MIVLDTSFLAALHNDRDGHHAAAQALQARLAANDWGTGILLEYVFFELMNTLAGRRGPEHAAGIGRFLLDSDLRFVTCSPLFEEFFEAFDRLQGGRLGLGDTAVAEIARALASGQVATFDRELARQPGIVAIP